MWWSMEASRERLFREMGTVKIRWPAGKIHSNTRIFTPNSPEWSNIQAECVAVAKIDAAEAKAGKDAR